MVAVETEQAKKEVNEWLDFQCISKDQREAHKDRINRLVNAMTEGYLVIDPKTHVITQRLRFPFGEDAKLEELRYKSSLTVDESRRALEVPEGEKEHTYSAGIGYVETLTGEVRSLILRMNHKDYKIVDAIVLFFML